MVTVVVPARDEAGDIDACIDALAAQDYPVNRMEILVVDGASSDDTPTRARQALQRWGFGATAVLTNPEGSTPSNLNVGLARATGSILCRVDARTRIERHHVRTCVEVLQARPEVAVVGGAQVAVARDASGRAAGIARALNNPYLMGGALYRRGRVSGATDTVYLGAFRIDQLCSIGGWDVRLPTNQDFDLNRRMTAFGLVWFESRLRSEYLPRRSLPLLLQQYVRFGRWKVRYWKTSGDRPLPRQRLLLVFPPTLLVVALTVLVLVPGSGLPLAVVGLVGLGAVDAVGGSGSASVTARGWSMVASLVVATGWWTGALLEAISSAAPASRRARRSGPRDA